MATVYLSPVFNANPQLGESLVLLDGGLLYTYQAGSAVAADTYTTSAGNVKNTNPIVLNSDGRPPHEIWLVAGQSYKFVLTDSLNNPVGIAIDNIIGVNDLTYISSILPPTIAGYANLPTVAAGGTGDALTAAFSPAITLVDKLTVIVKCSAANTVTNPTLNANSTGNVTIVKGSNSALAANDMAGADYWAILTYDGSLGKWVLNNPATGVFVPPSASNIGIQAAYKNLVCSANGTSSVVSITADELIVETTGNALYRALGVNASIDMTTSGANGLDTGTVAASTEYYYYIIWNGATIAGLASLSPTAPTMPGGYTYKARVSAGFTDATINKYPLGFKQVGNQARYIVTPATNVTALPKICGGALGTFSATVPTYQAESVTGFIPATASIANLSVCTSYNTVGNSKWYLAPNSHYSGQQTTNPPPYFIGSGISSTVQATLFLESTNIYVASDNTGFAVMAVGWVDNI